LSLFDAFQEQIHVNLSKLKLIKDKISKNFQNNFLKIQNFIFMNVTGCPLWRYLHNGQPVTKCQYVYLHEVDECSLPDRPALDFVIEICEELNSGQGTAERSLKHLKEVIKLNKCSGFQPFSGRGTFETLLSIWRNLGTQNSANFRIITEPSKE